MDVGSGWLDYGTLGLLALVLLGVGWALKSILARWLNQVEAGIRSQDASAGAMAAMASAMTALAASVLQHAKATELEHKAILDEVCKKRIPSKPRAKTGP